MFRGGMHHDRASHAQANDAKPDSAGISAICRGVRSHCRMGFRPVFLLFRPHLTRHSEKALADMDQTTSHKPTKRVEDDYLLRGAGRYMADAPLPGQTYACFVRSPHACADVKSIDTKAAQAIKGVIAVITAADIKAAEVKNVSQHPPVAGRNGGKLVMPVRPALAGDRVRHSGESGCSATMR
jgi:hypothetical protein